MNDFLSVYELLDAFGELFDLMHSLFELFVKVKLSMLCRLVCPFDGLVVTAGNVVRKTTQRRYLFGQHVVCIFIVELVVKVDPAVAEIKNERRIRMYIQCLAHRDVVFAKDFVQHDVLRVVPLFKTNPFRTRVFAQGAVAT